LLAKGAAVNAQNDEGVTALQVAIAIDRPDIVRALLAKKADPGIRDKNNRDAVAYAVEHGRYAYIPMLTGKKYDVNKLAENGDSLLMQAVKRGDEQQVATLLQLGANTEIRNRQGYTPLMIA